MYNRSKKLFNHPKFFHFTTSKANNKTIIKNNHKTITTNTNNNPQIIPTNNNIKRDAFYQTILINATKLQNFQKSRFFSSISKSENGNNNNNNNDKKSVENDTENLSRIKKDLKSLLDKEMNNFQIDKEQESFAKEYIEEMKYKITEEKEFVHLTRNLDAYLVTIKFKGNRIFLESSFANKNENQSDSENEYIKDKDLTETSDDESNISNEDEEILEDFKDSIDDFTITIQTNKSEKGSNNTLHFECRILGQKMYIQHITIDKVSSLPTSNDPLVFRDDSLNLEHLDPSVQSRVYDFVEELIGSGDRLVNFIDFYRSSRIANNSRDIIQTFKKFLDN